MDNSTDYQPKDGYERKAYESTATQDVRKANRQVNISKVDGLAEKQSSGRLAGKQPDTSNLYRVNLLQALQKNFCKCRKCSNWHTIIRISLQIPFFRSGKLWLALKF